MHLQDGMVLKQTDCQLNRLVLPIGRYCSTQSSLWYGELRVMSNFRNGVFDAGYTSDLKLTDLKVEGSVLTSTANVLGQSIVSKYDVLLDEFVGAATRSQCSKFWNSPGLYYGKFANRFIDIRFREHARFMIDVVYQMINLNQTVSGSIQVYLGKPPQNGWALIDERLQSFTRTIASISRTDPLDLSSTFVIQYLEGEPISAQFEQDIIIPLTPRS